MTGDPAVDAALQALGQADAADVETQIAAGERLEHDLSARLKDLAAE